VLAAGVQDLSLYFRALADQKRLRIVEYLAEHDQVTVTELGTVMRMSQPLISWHLRKLRRAGIVKTRRGGREVRCSLNRNALERYADEVDRAFGIRSAAGGDPDVEPRRLETAGNR
jgi:DNA-binding transcriptional ArsR family regulator